MTETVQKRVFRHVEHLRLLHMPIFAFLKQFSKIDDKNRTKTLFFWHVEHLRILHMPLFAFLEWISKIDDRNSAKTRFTACSTFANSAYAFISVSEAVFKT